MKPKTLTIIGILAVAAAIIVVMLLQGAKPTITLTSTPDIKRVEINGQSQDFSQNMRVVYDKKLTINASIDGYEFYSKTLDPAKDKIENFAIMLQKKDTSSSSTPPVIAAPPLSTEQKNLQQAAANSGEASLLALGNLNVNIVSTRSFQNGAYMFYIVSPKPPAQGDNAMLVVDNTAGRIVLGPGTDFGTVATLPPLPNEIVEYLKGIGAVHAQ